MRLLAISSLFTLNIIRAFFLLNNKIDKYENPEGPNLAVPYFFVAALLFDFRRFIIFLSVTIHHRNIKILATETYKFL